MVSGKAHAPIIPQDETAFNMAVLPSSLPLLTASNSQQAKSDQATIPDQSSLPLISTGPSKDTRSRGRSYSVDIVTKNISILNPDKNDEVTVL